MKLDRQLQYEILNVLANNYPDSVDEITIHINTIKDEKTIIANMLYLENHGLVNTGLQKTSHGYYFIGDTEITAQGLDFLANDGGLSAILGTVTIKIHDDQFRLLLTSCIEQAPVPEHQKKEWLDQLQQIPAEATKHLVQKIIDAGLSQLPGLLAAAHKLMS